MEYTSPGAALSQGLQSGLSLATNFAQIKAQRDQVKWERDLKVAEIAMKHADNKNLKPDQRAKFFNEGVLPVFKRMGINMPPMDAQSIAADPYADALKNSNAIIDQMQSGKMDPHVGFNAISQHWTGALQQMETETEAQKATREMSIAQAKRYADEADKRGGADKTPTATEAIKRQTELDFQLANINKLGTFEQQIAIEALKKDFPNLQEGKVDQAQINALKNGVLREKSLLNEYIPDKYRSKTPITIKEFHAMRLAKPEHSLEDFNKDFTITDAPPGQDPLKFAASLKTRPMVAPAASTIPVAPAPGPMPGAGVRPVTPPPLATPAPMAAPAPVVAPPPTAGPLSLSGGAVQSTEAGPLQLQNQSFQ